MHNNQCGLVVVRERFENPKYVLMGESYQAIMIDHDNDPISYNDALEDVDVQEWLKES